MKSVKRGPEAWLRGPVPDVPTALQPVAHALVQALEHAARMTAGLDRSDLWTRLGGAASIGFHLRHMARSLDRLLTYARGEPLSGEQWEELAEEKVDDPDTGVDELLQELRSRVDRALSQLRATPEDQLDVPLVVGRAELPSSARGLLHHAGEHTARHAGQISTTLKILRGLRADRPL